MMKLTTEQISVSTAEEENNYFTGQPEAPVRPCPNAILPPGTYRVIDGELYRIVFSGPDTVAGANVPIFGGADENLTT